MMHIPEGFWEDSGRPMPTVIKIISIAILFAQVTAVLGEQEKLGEFYEMSIWLRLIISVYVAVVFVLAFVRPSVVRKHYRGIMASWTIYFAIIMSLFQYWSYDYITTQYFYIGTVQILIGFCAIIPIRSLWAYVLVFVSLGIFIIPHSIIASDLPHIYEEIQYSGIINFIMVALVVHHVYMYIRIGAYEKKMKLHQRQVQIDAQNAQLEELNKKLEQSNDTKDKFFSLLAHDLRGPLSSFKMGMEIISDENRNFNEESRSKFIEVMKNSSKNVLNLLENLLVWSKSERGIMEFDPNQYALRDVLGECYLLVHGQAENKGVALSCYFGKDIQIYCDTNMLTTIMRNLLSNAIKFTPKGGVIDVHIEDMNDYVQFNIKDSGVGIKAEDIDKLFMLKTNKSSYGTEGEKGNGLGLILCKEFVEKHGGKLSFESEVGVGTTVSFTIPNQNI
jgi:signal transduction histidine kinase